MTEIRRREAIVKMATDPTFAERVRVDPESVAREFDLDANDMAALEALRDDEGPGASVLDPRLSKSSLFFGGHHLSGVGHSDDGSAPTHDDGFAPPHDDGTTTDHGDAASGGVDPSGGVTLNADGTTTEVAHNEIGGDTSVTTEADGSRYATEYDSGGQVVGDVSRATDGSEVLGTPQSDGSENYSYADAHGNTVDGAGNAIASPGTGGDAPHADITFNQDGSSTETSRNDLGGASVVTTSADGSRYVTNYDSEGQITGDVSIATDGTEVLGTPQSDGSENYSYADAHGNTVDGAGNAIASPGTGGDAPHADITFNQDGSSTETSRNDLGGASVVTTSADGSRYVTNYDSEGQITGDVSIATDGSEVLGTPQQDGSENYSYVDADGNAVDGQGNVIDPSQTVDSDGTDMVFHEDGSWESIDHGTGDSGGDGGDAGDSGGVVIGRDPGGSDPIEGSVSGGSVGGSDGTGDSGGSDTSSGGGVTDSGGSGSDSGGGSGGDSSGGSGGDSSGGATDSGGSGGDSGGSGGDSGTPDPGGSGGDAGTPDPGGSGSAGTPDPEGGGGDGNSGAAVPAGLTDPGHTPGGDPEAGEGGAPSIPADSPAEHVTGTSGDGGEDGTEGSALHVPTGAVAAPTNDTGYGTASYGAVDPTPEAGQGT